MKFTNDSVRRQDRLLDEESSVFLLKNGEYGIMSMQSETGGGYGIPLNYAWDGDSSIYLHCAPQGKKLRCIELCRKVSFCVVGRTEVVPDRFTTSYESIVLDCQANMVPDPEERIKALELLLEKYSPGHKTSGMKYAEKSFHRTDIIRLDIIEFSGKCKKVKHMTD